MTKPTIKITNVENKGKICKLGLMSEKGHRLEIDEYDFMLIGRFMGWR